MYAARIDIETIYGADALLVAMNADGIIDDAKVVRGLEAATAEIDSYIANRYPLPLPETPPVLRNICVDITTYRLSQTADAMTDIIRERYEDAIKWLDKVSVGKISLGLPKAPGQKSAKAVVVTGSEKLFTREKLRGI